MTLENLRALCGDFGFHVFSFGEYTREGRVVAILSPHPAGRRRELEALEELREAVEDERTAGISIWVGP